MASKKITTVKEIESLLSKGIPAQHAIGDGLYIKITGNNSGSWVFRYQWGNQRHRIGMGKYNTLSLAEARLLAQDFHRLILQGINPIEAKKAQQAHEETLLNITFAQLADEYINIHKSAWKNEKHIQQWQNTLKTYAFPIIGKLSPNEITTDHITQILEPIWIVKNETANRLRNRIESVLDYAKAKKLRAGDNPATWKGNMEYLLSKTKKKVKHHSALSWTEAPEFWKTLVQEDSFSSYALQLAILTATRTNEVLGAKWKEFDFKNQLWIIPAERMKREIELRVPLSKSALDLLEHIPRTQNPYVFIGTKDNTHLSNMSMAMKCRRMHEEKLKQDHIGWVDATRQRITPHGFRSTFRDWAAETTNFPNIVVEQALAHAIGNAVEAAYRRGDLLEKRQKLMQEWDHFLTKNHN